MRLKIAYCGICGTDLHEYAEYEHRPLRHLLIITDKFRYQKPWMVPKDGRNKYSGAELPQILGHEFSGTIVEVGAQVNNYKMGQRVTVNPAINDQQRGLDPCEFCLSGRRNICPKITFYGINDKGGGFADEIAVKASSLVPLPDNVSLRVAALAEPLAVAAHMIRVSGFRAGQDAVVLGAGPIGCSLTFFLKDSGARQVIVSEVATSRSAQAKSCGADRVVNPVEEDVLKIIHEHMGPGADVVFDACGLQATLDTAIACTKPGGTIFNVAIHEEPINLNMNLLTIPEKRLLAGNAYTKEDFDRVIRVLTTRSSEVEKFVTATVALENAIEGAFLELINHKAKHNKILVEVAGEDG